MDRTKVRIALAVVLLCTGLYNLAASPPYEYDRQYYTDATKTVECGYKLVFCDYSYATGCRTAYYEDTYLGPCGGGGGGGTGECNDWYDNDGDGKIDMADPGCSSGYDTSESG